MAIDYVALKNEIQNDPTALGYASKQDQQIADLLNLVRVSITIRRTDISAAEIWSAIDTADMVALPGTPTNAQLSDERRKIGWLTGVSSVPSVRLQNDNGTDTPVITMAKSIFTNGSGTLTRLNALATRTGTRAEQLFGSGTFINAADIVKAKVS